ncbi:MAG TPA: hypothetical protein VFK89_03640 [Actinomycetota bacterium]|nr:hypothetical protein [Actinomycetota bacterium]
MTTAQVIIVAVGSATVAVITMLVVATLLGSKTRKQLREGDASDPDPATRESP